MRISVGHRLSLEVKTAREGDSLYLLLTIHTDWGAIPIHIGVHADTLRGLATWLRANYGPLVYEFVTAKKPLR